MLERYGPGLVEEDVDDNSLRGSEDDVLHELLPLHVAAVAADELRPGPLDSHFEHPRVRRVSEVEAHDLSELRAQRELRLAGDKKRGAEAPHRDVVGLVVAEGRHTAVLVEQDVVEREQDLAIRRRPVLGLARDDEDVAVEAHLLAVVLANVRVVPVEAFVRESQLVCVALAHRDRPLRLVRAVVLVFDPQPVPVHGRLEIAVVDRVHENFRALPYLQRRSRDRSVVGKHANPVPFELLGDRRNSELELVALGEFDDFGTLCLRQTLDRSRKLDRSRMAVGWWSCIAG